MFASGHEVKLASNVRFVVSGGAEGDPTNLGAAGSLVVYHSLRHWKWSISPLCWFTNWKWWFPIVLVFLRVCYWNGFVMRNSWFTNKKWFCYGFADQKNLFKKMAITIGGNTPFSDMTPNSLVASGKGLNNELERSTIFFTDKSTKIEHGHRKFVDFASYKMVIFQFVI